MRHSAFLGTLAVPVEAPVLWNVDLGASFRPRKLRQRQTGGSAHYSALCLGTERPPGAQSIEQLLPVLVRLTYDPATGAHGRYKH